MSKNLLLLVSFALSLVFSQVTLADSSLCGERIEQMVSSLNLAKDQKEKIKPVLDQLKSTVKENASQMDDLDKQLKQQADSATMDQSAVDGLVDKKAALIGNMMKAKISAKNQILNVLDAQQKTKLQDMMKKAEEKMAAKFKSCHDQA